MDSLPWSASNEPPPVTQELRKLIDREAPQAVINERIHATLERQSVDIARIGSDHEKRIRFLERTVSYALGAIGLVTFIVELVKK